MEKNSMEDKARRGWVQDEQSQKQDLDLVSDFGAGVLLALIIGTILLCLTGCSVTIELDAQALTKAKSVREVVPMGWEDTAALESMLEEKKEGAR